MHFIFKGDIITATPTSSKSSGELGKNEKSSIEDMDYYYRAESANEIISNKDDHVEEETTVDTYLDQALNRGALLRQWKLLAEAELQAAEEEEKKEEEDIVQIDEDYTIDFKEENDSKTKPVKVLRYNQYLQHQRYHDDYKQVNYKFIDFGNVTDPTSDYNKLVIQQDRSLGKGGLVSRSKYCHCQLMISNSFNYLFICHRDSFFFNLDMGCCFLSGRIFNVSSFRFTQE